MMKNALPIVLFALIALFVVSNSPGAEEADLLFVNGTVYTVDADDSITQALAVKDGKIVFVGNKDDAEKFKGEKTEVVDLRGGMLIPGMFDTHIHSSGPHIVELEDFTLPGINDEKSLMSTIADEIAKKPDNTFYHAFGFPTNVFTGDEALKGPRKERLDKICPDKPIVITSYDGHTVWMNGKAFEMAGITKETSAPKGGVIEHDDATGELWGTLKDGATALAPQPSPTPEKLTAVVDRFQKTMNRLGCTSIMSMCGMDKIFPVPYEAFAALEKEGKLTLRVNAASPFDPGKDFDAQLNMLKERRAKYETKLLRVTTAKIFSDGVIDTRTAFLMEPYCDNPPERKKYCGDEYWSVEEMNETFAKLNAAGLQIHVHSVGDASTKQVLDAFEYAAQKAPPGDYRNTITHLQLVRPEDISRFAKLKVVAAIQPYWFSKYPGFWKEVELVALGDRANRMYPLKSFFDAGVKVASSSDSPVTMFPYALPAIEEGVTRNLVDAEAIGLSPIKDIDDPACLLWPEERATVKQMIRSFTADAAYSLFSDKYCGSLEVGKLADLVILDRNILEGSPIGIHKTKVLRTYLEGKLVYEAVK